MQLVQTPSPPDLRQFVADLAEGVEAGDITGMGAIVVLKGRRFFVDVFGSMARDPYAARGYVLELDDCLREIGKRRKNTNTTL